MKAQVFAALVLLLSGCYASHERDPGSDAGPTLPDAGSCPIVARIPIGIATDAGTTCAAGPCYCVYRETPQAIAECTRCDCVSCFRFGD